MSLKINNFYNKYFSNLAINLAKINKYITSENPSVGCVVVDFQNKILSTDYTSEKGRPHAEFNALNKLKSKVKKKIFVSLEPCNHFGKTAPCTHLICKKNVKEVHCSNIDMNPSVKGKGINFLKQSKILTTVHSLHKDIFYRKYSYAMMKKIPHVSAKLALTKNLSTVFQNKKYFTNSKSLKFAHLLRYKNDSILIGKKTLNKDLPKLNCRLSGLEKFSPRIFLINSNLSFQKKQLLMYPKNTVIFHASSDLKKISKLKKYFLLEKIKENHGILSATDMLKKIYNYNCRRLLIEGGLETIKYFHKHMCINKFYLVKSNLHSKNTKNSASNFVKLLSGNNLDKYKVKINLDNNYLYKI
jgi:diaminohydroxyphosphoribosylaminopyrimidine deaminase/5-amino-6-(5-phosphoribosylamino)uracil reductase